MPAGVAAALAAVLVAIAMPVSASADTTALSTFTKTANDATTGSSAAGGGAAGSTRAGDTIDWVLHYQNNTSSSAGVVVHDQIAGNQSLVPSSVKGPPNLQVSCTFPAAANCSSLPATGQSFAANGTVPAGTTNASGVLSTGVTNFTTPGGDGYSIEGAGGNIYTVFHHTSLSTTVFCATLTNQLCPGWPGFSTYVDPTAGTPLGTGAAGRYSTADLNGSFIAGGKLYWPVEATAAVSGSYPVGVQCLDLTTRNSCGFVQLDTASLPPAGTGTAGRAVGRIASDGIAAPNGDVYLFDGNGRLLCFSPAAGAACGTFNVTGGVGVQDPGAGALANMLTLGSRVYLSFIRSGTLHEELTCFDTSTSALCGASPSPFPIDDGVAANGSYADFVAPVLSANGTPLGACDVDKHTCVDPTGASLADPYPGFNGFGYPGSSVGFGSGAIAGARFYAGDLTTGKIDCFDFSARVGSGAVPACAGYTPPADASNYTVRPLANLPGCLAADGDAAKIVVFNGQNGGVCATASTQVSVTPAAYYCDGQAGHAQHWKTLTLNGLTGSEYGGASVTLIGPNGPIAGYTDLQLAPNQTSLDLSSLPVSGNTASLTAQITLSAVTNTSAVQAASVVLSFSGDPIQICFQTKVGASTCESPPVISNTAYATTNAGVSGSDLATGGNSSAAATFNEAPDTSQCHPSMTIDKIADAALGDQTPIRVGETIQYSYLVTNTGNVSIPTISVDDASIKGGVSCPKPGAPGLAPGQSETCTANAAYVVTQQDVDKGSADDTATVSCSDRYGDSCPPADPSSTHVPSSPKPAVAIDKIATVTPAADQGAAKVGDSIQFTYKVTNTGNVTEKTISVDDATLGPVRCPVPNPPGLAPGDSLRCTAVSTRTVTQADVDRGEITDTATAACTDTQGRSCPESDPSTAKVPMAAANPQVSVKKIANASGGDTNPLTLNETIQYSYLVRNTGNVTLKSVAVTDPTAGAVTCPSPAAPGLAPGQSILCSADVPYTVTQDDVDHGSVTDTASAECTDTTGGECPTEPPSSTTVPGTPVPQVAIDKLASVVPGSDRGAVKIGDRIAYSYKVTNVGNVDLAKIIVNDPTIGPVTCPTPAAPGLAPAASLTCTAGNTHPVRQADVDAGTVRDTATAGCVDSSGHACSPSNQATVIVPTVPARPLTSIVKTARVIPAADRKHAKVGDKIRYTFKVKNIGNVDLERIAVSDPRLGRVKCPKRRSPGLAPGRSETCTAGKLHTVSLADAKRGKIANVATSTGIDPRGQVSAVSRRSTATVHAVRQRLKLSKTASVKRAKPGQNVTYKLRVSNPGHIAVARVTVCDSMPAGLIYVSSRSRAHLRLGRYCWVLKRLGPHVIHTFTITANVAPSHRHTATNHATASAPGIATVRAAAAVRIVTARRVPCVRASGAGGSGPPAHAAC